MIIFRADGNPQIGAGHIMRCLAIANKAKDYGESCLFVVSSDDLQKVIVDSGHGIKNLKSDYSRMEMCDILIAVDAYNPRVVFVDSYFVTEKYLSLLHKKCRDKGAFLVYVDDRCIFPYSCDYLLNYNVYARREMYERLYSDVVQPIFLLGPLYTPLREEFQGDDRRIVSRQAENIFVSTGGTDTEHLTVNIVKAAAGVTNYTFHFVVGMMNPDKEELIEMAEKYKNIIIHENVKRMDELMRLCDVAISAAGSTLYELCATQTPSVTYVLADNQIPAAKEFGCKGIIKSSGDVRVLGNVKLASTLVEDAVLLAEEYEERKKLSDLMRAVVDGNGVSRIIQRILL